MSWTLGGYGIRTQDFGNKAGVCYFDNMKYDTSSISVSTAARRFTSIGLYKVFDYRKLVLNVILKLF